MVLRNLVLALVVALTVAILAAGAASAGDGRIERRIALAPPAAGNSLDISGTARIRKEGLRQDFKVSMDAPVPNGTVFRVFVTNDRVDGDPFLAGQIVITAGRGELELSNENGGALPRRRAGAGHPDRQGQERRRADRPPGRLLAPVLPPLMRTLGRKAPPGRAPSAPAARP